MLSRSSRVHAVLLRAVNARMFASDAARPMTRFIQFPFDKTKMEEVRAWCNENKIGEQMRAIPGIKDVEVSFCPGEGWLAGRYIFNDLEDLLAFGDNPTRQKLVEEVMKHPYYDNTREPREFKGFYLSEV